MTEIRDSHEHVVGVHDPGDATHEDMCTFAMDKVQAFLHGELPEATADEIRQHLLMCEHCMDYYDVEQMISAMIKRCSCTPMASEQLRVRITAITRTRER
ncbi:zf-HC2 domain-containing protein [Propionibacterium sp.]|uniref:zf-HC2 domain-containing protein n=1 Tax=Propionibacterium sp. TaxID=1977903 RepID=UPI0039ED6F4E